MGPNDEGGGGVFAAEMILLSAFVLVLVGGIILARRNIRFGRLDRRGAFRIALYLFALTLLTWIIATHHVTSVGEISRFFFAVQWALFVAVRSYGPGWTWIPKTRSVCMALRILLL